jgi:hypothetical protein
MTRSTVTVDATPLTVNFVDPPPTAMRPWAIASGHAQDEMTEAPPASLLDVRLAEPRLGINYGDDCGFCVVARPWLAFPPLFAPDYQLGLTVNAAGYAPLDLTVDVPSRQRSIIAPAPASGDTVVALNDISLLEAGQMLLLGPASKTERRFITNLGPGAQQVTLDSGLVQARAVADPVVADAWTPIDLGVLGLRRNPVTIHGRAARRDALTNVDIPVANATIAVTDFWWTLGAVRTLQPGLMTNPNPALRAFALSVEPGIYAERSIATAQLASLTLQIPAGDDHLLLDAAAAGATSIRVSNRQLLTPGTFLRIDPNQGDNAETMRIVSISGWGTPDQPGVAALAFPLRNAHRAGTIVRRALNPFPPGPTKAFRRDAAPGDRCVFVDDLGGLASGSDVQITSAATPNEYQRVTQLVAVSDADGYFRFPAIQRIAALQLHATAAALAAVDLKLQPDYSQAENWLDVVFA